MDLVFCTLVTLDLVQCFSDIVTLHGDRQECVNY